MSRRDVSTTDDIWFASVLLFVGYELCSITEQDGRQCTYKIQCPQLDFEELESQYRNNELPLSDAKSFVNAFNTISQLQKDYRRRGNTQWTNPRWVSGEIG
jgi:hypothetical protein